MEPNMCERDSQAVKAISEAYFAKMLHQVLTDPERVLADDALPLARIKRIMKQDSCNPHPCMVSADAVQLIAYIVRLFIGHVTTLAWELWCKPAKRNTLQIKDAIRAVPSMDMYDYLIDVIDESVSMMPKQDTNDAGTHQEASCSES